MATVDETDTTCSVFGSIRGADPGTLLRFVVGEDTRPIELTAEQIGTDLHDALAQLVFARGTFPTTADELLAVIDAAGADDGTLSAETQRSFLLGESSQLLLDDDDISSTNSGMRFLVSRGAGPEGPDLIISASKPDAGLVEVMAWDKVNGGFNYYRNLGDSGEWAFAGNSRHALAPPTKGKGPFESHPSGNLLMKELKLPWVHWDSFKARILPSVFDPSDVRRTHPWFVNKEGAENCEIFVVLPSIARWTSVRLAAAVPTDGEVADPARVIEQFVTCPTVNLTSSSSESDVARSATTVDLPPTFFVDADCLPLAGLPSPPSFAVAGTIYDTSLATFEFALRDGIGFEQAADTHFAFTVPERAAEDVELVRQAIQRGLVTPRLAACLLMVDFANPIFSARRAALLAHIPPTATMVAGASEFSTQMADLIRSADQAEVAGTPENEFKELWDVGEAFLQPFTDKLKSYYTSIQQRLGTQDGFNDYTRLAEARRNRVRDMPIFESRLLFAETNIDPTELVMAPDGSVVPVGV